MTQEEKELLLKDLCARFPYGVMVHLEKFVMPQKIHWSYVVESGDWKIPKPYLRLMSSMTNHERLEYFNLTKREILDGGYVTDNSVVGVDNVSEFTDWLNAHHFDYRHLIEKGLAFEAPEGMYE